MAVKLTERQAYVAQSLGGKVHGHIRDGEFRIRSRRNEDGSRFQPTKDARKSIERILHKSGLEAGPLAEALQKFDESPDNEHVEVVPGLEVVKWSVEKIAIDLSDSRPMSSLVPLKIAFEFLACHLGAAIYDNAAQLLEIRQVLRGEVEGASCFRVDRLTAPEYKPFHGICFEGNKPHAHVLIRLFGRIAFRVHLLRLSVGGPRFIYTHYLDTKRENVRIWQ